MTQSGPSQGTITILNTAFTTAPCRPKPKTLTDAAGREAVTLYLQRIAAKLTLHGRPTAKLEPDAFGSDLRHGVSVERRGGIALAGR